MATNDFVHKNISNESCSSDLDVISLYYDGDSLISGQKSRESMSSIDEYLATSQYDEGFKFLLIEESSYALALRRLIKGIGNVQTSNCTDYIARKILNKRNDNLLEFFDELKTMESVGYKFDFVMINLLMEYCVQKFDMGFYQFIQTRIINKLSKADLDQLNQDIFSKFIKVRMAHVAQQRYLGLPRSTRKSITKNDK